MTSGLKYLHDLRVIHRDMKPSNALISASGRVKLADFGLARTLDCGQSLADSFVGTFDYMSPERLTGESYSLISDVWSLGVTLYIVSVGRHPYGDRKGYWELVHATQESDIPSPSQSFPQDLSEVFSSFVKYACVRDFRQRPSAAALLSHPFIAQHDFDKIVAITAPVTTATALPTPQGEASGGGGRGRKSTLMNTTSSQKQRVVRSYRGGGTGGVAVSANTRSYAAIAGTRTGDARGELFSRAANTKSSTSSGKLPDIASVPISSAFTRPLSAVAADLGFGRQNGSSSLASEDLRKLVKYWKSYVLQLKRFNSSTPSVLKTSRSAATTTTTTTTTTTAAATTARYRTPRNVHGALSARGPAGSGGGGGGGMQKGKSSPISMEIEEKVLLSLAKDLYCDREMLINLFRQALEEIKTELGSPFEAYVLPSPPLTEPVASTLTDTERALPTARRGREKLQKSLSESRKNRRRSTIGNSDGEESLPIVKRPLRVSEGPLKLPEPVALSSKGASSLGIGEEKNGSGRSEKGSVLGGSRRSRRLSMVETVDGMRRTGKKEGRDPSPLALRFQRPQPTSRPVYRYSFVDLGSKEAPGGLPLLSDGGESLPGTERGWNPPPLLSLALPLRGEEGARSKDTAEGEERGSVSPYEAPSPRVEAMGANLASLAVSDTTSCLSILEHPDSDSLPLGMDRQEVQVRRKKHDDEEKWGLRRVGTMRSGWNNDLLGGEEKGDHSEEEEEDEIPLLHSSDSLSISFNLGLSQSESFESYSGTEGQKMSASVLPLSEEISPLERKEEEDARDMQMQGEEGNYSDEEYEECFEMED